ncbi:polyphosphate kinase 1 [Flavobacterium branchiophilum]|uniref:Polyphosphate kinase n=2 Tax=Flavobacterium branchiophilum TaxID=55197 RepID=G2Z1B4_FLABF|nr:polyphosphate kinase 1 [Flavobacterium branchiophilum]OXA75982.1 polyphosphate kinase 1 [Flavobacterium branchiophilum] [Flavobacterium branchiophilum NBRC 15030 = ATCC 35035]PDS26921.1 polyphosphate kinase 1 [Flavobacterium branchiophilum]TQM42123.1 polyphosphate kinase [Flavobacterium branchiophilum]CCB69677.1 Polyphosphate kinase [Flavobacterium branchiophilum FL-15]GEM53896.1 polyphosphate kinase [Flavobacterium branchiophilum NBRC 15030 = ATCC 35035]
MNLEQNSYIDREKSWLNFNARVLQEASDENVPLLDRLRFLGIFSNNLDEFFRVRFAAIRRLTLNKASQNKMIGTITAKQLIKDITEIAIKQQSESLRILGIIEKKLEEQNIFIINESEILDEHKTYIKDFFVQKVAPALVTIILNDLAEFPLLKDTFGYLAVKLTMKSKVKSKLLNLPLLKPEIRYAVIEIPKSINRFVVLPSIHEKQYIIMIDDVIRLHLQSIFNIFDYEQVSAHMIKITRDAQLEIDSDLSKSMLEKIATSVKERRIGEPVRFIYDQSIEKDTLKFFLKKMGIDASDSIIPGGRYHNRRDYMDFPDLGRKDLLYKTNPPLLVPGLSLDENIMKKIGEKDYLVNAPYQTFSYIIKFLREAALDPQVTSIKITLYRLSKNSQIISSLINAAKNGKKVVVQIELQARFDEASNISYAEQMQTEGIELIFGVKGLKVHSKICVIDRIEEGKLKRYGFVSTGNFNESTAKVYTDVTLLTSHQQILKDISKVFDFFEVNFRIHRYQHLIVSPHYTRSKLVKLIDKEIKLALAGIPTFIKLKMNSLSDFQMIDKLYEASRAGVKIQLIVRGICSLIPGKKGLSDNIEAISIVDNYLEHTRLFIFGNGGKPDVFISSADFMARNLDGRVEVTCPIYDPKIKQDLIDSFDLGWKGNVKVRLHSENLDNKYRIRKDNEPVFRAQLESYRFYQKKIK